MHILHEIGIFVWAVINNWASYSTGGIIVAIMTLWYAIKGSSAPRKVVLGLTLLWFIIGSFKAWQEQHRNAIKVQMDFAKHIEDEAIGFSGNVYNMSFAPDGFSPN